MSTPKQKKRGRRRAAHDPDVGETISEFCASEKIAPSTFHLWRKSGRAPDVFQPAGPGGRVRILPEAKTAWRTRFSVQPPPVEAAE
jgi:hypothetical protein